MPNLLATRAGLKLGPVVLETFFKHYLERKTKTHDEDGHSSILKDDDLLWQEAFVLIKHFLNEATKYSVEELQEFSKTRIPTPPWIWVSRVLVPTGSCDLAATHLIKALGGEEVAKRVVGGTKWWQVRGLHGIDGQWICQKSHMHDARRRKKAQHARAYGHDFFRFSSGSRLRSILKSSNSQTNTRQVPTDDQKPPGSEEQHVTETDNDKEIDVADMNGTPCMLYAHGGGYYFGSVDQERYCLQRYARKIRGRIFACNYRLSPQYPFPCAIQDVLAAYLYLIDPPPDAPHSPVPPESLVLGGDSAGGGLCLAVLQVIRDSGLPLPAGAVLISPWCDLTHSFPSTVQNRDTDIIPPYGLSLHKPSVLWPPPPDEISLKVRAGIRARFQKVARRAAMVEALFPPETRRRPSPVAQNDQHSPMDIEVSNLGPELPKGTDGSKGSTVAGRMPLPWESSDSFHLKFDGKSIAIHTQLQFYCLNSLLVHPLVSPALGYLGGLPPLLVIASDKEVLRDEIIYLAHKAAHPDRFPVSEDSRKIYPPLQGIGDTHSPTLVHLQVYDETAHVLPLFSFTTPAKYCYRAIASFVKHFTMSSNLAEPLDPSAARTLSLEDEEPPLATPEDIPSPPSPNPTGPYSWRRDIPSGMRRVSSILRSHSSLITSRNRSGVKSRTVSLGSPQSATNLSRNDSGDVAANRFQENEGLPHGPGTAGDPSVYDGEQALAVGGVMIRERVSTQGVVRPLEPESELAALQLQPDHIGKVNEVVAQRYLEGQAKWAKKFARTAAKIEAQRQKNLELSKGETNRTVKTMAQFQEHLFREQKSGPKEGTPIKRRPFSFSLHRPVKDGPHKMSDDIERHTWGWAWALDGEHPPPSSIVSRRDTVEARSLARVADLSVEQAESKQSGNMLWNVLGNFLNTSNDDKKGDDDEWEGAGVETNGKSGRGL